MAESDKIKSSDIIQEDLFANTTKSANELLQVIEALKKEMVGVAEASAKLAQKQSKSMKNADDINKVNKALSESNKALKEAENLDKEAIKLKTQLTQLSDEEVKGKIRFQEAAKKQKQLLREQVQLENQQIGTLARLNIENKQLRREREGLNLETAKGQKRLKEINATLDKNNAKIRQNSDQLKKQKLNVGNYTDSVKDAVNQSGLFSSQLATIQRIQGTLNAILKKNTVETEANAVAQKTASTASGGFSKALKVLKIALISTGIGAIVVALGALATAFGTTQRGADAFTKVLRPLSTIFERFVGFLQDTGFKVFDRLKAAFNDPKQAVIDLAGAIKDNLIARFEAIGVFGSAIAKLFRGEFKEGFAELGDASIQLATGVENASEKIQNLSKDVAEFTSESIKQGEQLDELIKRFERREIDLTVPIQEARLEFEKFRAIAQDQTKTDEERIQALNEAEKLQRFIIEGEQELLDLQIQRIELEQTFNDTSREDELELEKLKAQRLASEAAAQKKINSLIAQRSSIEKRQQTERDKELERLQKIGEQLDENNKKLEGGDEKKKIDETLEARKKANEENIRLSQGSIKSEQDARLQREEIQDAEIQAAKDFAELSKIIAGENEEAQKRALQLQKIFATSEVLINLERQISEIKATVEDDREKRVKIVQATASSALSVAKIQAQGSAFDGVEDTGTGGKVDDRGGMYWILHPNERVMSKAQNQKVGDLSNDELANIAMMYNKGELINPFTDMSLNVTNNQDKKDNSNYLILSELRNLQATIKNKPVSQFAFDSLGNLIETRYRNGVKDLIKYKSKKAL